jgi:hypothetical protein
MLEDGEIISVEINYRNTPYSDAGYAVDHYEVGRASYGQGTEGLDPGVLRKIELINENQGVKLSYSNGAIFIQETGVYNYTRFDAELRNTDKDYKGL